jgi:tetratricopeptide (TPR) repeat protein
MRPQQRLPCIHHCTSEPYRFFGRDAELALLDRAFDGDATGVVALVGPGGQGKTAIVQHWLVPFLEGRRHADGLFLWSFYRGKDADLCLRELYAYAAGMDQAADVSATWCVDHLLPVLRRERWALVLDGTEVVQYDGGPWFGRFVHPELSRLLEELASAPLPGVVLLTSRFPLPELQRRRYARVIGLSRLDAASARGLLASLGVCGSEAELDEAAAAGGFHAKAVELLGTFLVRFRQGEARRQRDLPELPPAEGASEEEHHVARVLAAHQAELSREAQDILALATAFRDPPTEARLMEYLVSEPVQHLLHDTWGREYLPFARRPDGWLAEQVNELVTLRLLERVGTSLSPPPSPLPPHPVIDAHPLVRRGFEHVLGSAGRRQSAVARAGFLRGRPDRRRPASLEQAREEVELFHAYCDAGLWNEADGTYVALDNPKHRFLAPAFERDLLLRFFPDGDWHRPPRWAGFGRYRSLAICFELLGQFEDALAAYRESDAALRGDALLALGRLGPLLDQPQAAHPWQTLWHAYRAHALCLAGRTAEAVALARSLVPVDVYEWVHVFECLLRAGQLAAIDMRSVLFRPPHAAEQRWAELARQRMQADYRRVTEHSPADLGAVYESLTEAYDRGGLPFERALTRLGHARWLLACGEGAQARAVNATTLELARRFRMPVVEADALAMMGGEAAKAEDRLRREVGYHGPARP